MGTTGGQALLVGYLSEAYLLAGRTREAVRLAGRALDLARAHQERGHEAWALRLLSEIAAHQAPPEAEPAEHHYRQALALAVELGMRPLVAHCHHGLGQLYARIGCRAKARAELSAAVELYRMMDMSFWLPHAEAALAQVEGPVMDLLAVVDQVVSLLRSRGWVSYRALKRQFGLDDAYLDDLKAEFIEVQQLAVDQNSTVLVWTGDGGARQEPPPPQIVDAQQPQRSAESRALEAEAWL
jgi:hypothetical protein